MGAWGTGIFDNDDAADWGWELSEHGMAAVESALDAALGPGYLEAPEGARAIAAADVVARLRSGGGEASPYAESVASWIDENQVRPPPALVDRAIVAIGRVRGPDSELRELWTEAGDALNEWLAGLDELEARLTA